ncbi:MAG: sulfotransferase [Cyclobacteriaceae bacterium]|nr:sulfotransferase [Cyclobacteriaceae bacterium]
MAKHVLILGCGRSGTSILGELFQAIPYYRYLSEPDLDILASVDFRKPIAVKVPRPLSHHKTSPGLPFYWPDFTKIIAEPVVIIWQVRHPLDSICSLIVGISRNWGHHPRPQDWQEWCHKSLIERCAYHWNYLNTKGYRQVKNRAVVNRFEDMISNPLDNAQKVLAIAGVDIPHYQEEVANWAQRVQNTSNRHFVEAECSIPYSTQDHRVKVDRWKENLSVNDLSLAIPLVSSGAREFLYSLPELEKLGKLQ